MSKPYERPPEQFDLFHGQRAKEEALNKADPDWMAMVLFRIHCLPKDWVGTGEDIRRVCADFKPRHPNAWGAAVSHAIKRKLILPTGRWKKMTSATSHARMTPEYRR